MRITLPHYFDFGEDRSLVGDDLVRPEAWDALRTKTDGPFALPEGRADWERMANEREDIRLRAIEIDRWLDSHSMTSLASYGGGGGSLELWLHRLTPERRMIVTDFGASTVARLAQVFPEVDVRQHDLLTNDPLDVGLHLFHRIDTELSSQQWRSVFRRFSNCRILLVATEVIDLRRAWAELKRWRRGLSDTRAGQIRNRAAFETLWRRTHRQARMRVGDLEAWALEPKDLAEQSDGAS